MRIPSWTIIIILTFLSIGKTIVSAIIQPSAHQPSFSSEIPNHDSCRSIDGRVVGFRYYALYKPALTLCSFDAKRSIQKNKPYRATLADLKQLPSGLHTVGRLDRDSEGLLLLTDDGQFTQQVHAHTAKVYWACVQGEPSERALQQMRQGGLEIRGVTTLPPLSVKLLPAVESKKLLPPAVLGMDRGGGHSWIEIILQEGRNRQVRRITQTAGHPTKRLVRVAIGSLSLFTMDPPLQVGDFQPIDPIHIF